MRTVDIVNEPHAVPARAPHFALRTAVRSSSAMDRVTIDHNPVCGKSHGALEILRERGVDCDVVEYLKQSLDRAGRVNQSPKFSFADVGRASHLARRGAVDRA